MRRSDLPLPVSALRLPSATSQSPRSPFRFCFQLINSVKRSWRRDPHEAVILFEPHNFHVRLLNDILQNPRVLGQVITPHIPFAANEAAALWCIHGRNRQIKQECGFKVRALWSHSRQKSFWILNSFIESEDSARSN
jgi:hypothetical protein